MYTGWLQTPGIQHGVIRVSILSNAECVLVDRVVSGDVGEMVLCGMKYFLFRIGSRLKLKFLAGLSYTPTLYIPYLS